MKSANKFVQKVTNVTNVEDILKQSSTPMCKLIETNEHFSLFQMSAHVCSQQYIGSIHGSQQYIDLLCRKLLPELETLFPDESGVFQQDLALCHTLKQVKKNFIENEINILE